MTVEHAVPSAIAEQCGLLSRTHDVGEEDGRQGAIDIG
jgi:hypothetical protein